MKLDTLFHQLLRRFSESRSSYRQLATGSIPFGLRSEELVSRHVIELAIVEIDLLMETSESICLELWPVLHGTP